MACNHRTVTFDPAPPRAVPDKAYIVIVDDDVDCIFESLTLARAHMRELRDDFGCSPEMHVCPWAEQDAFIESLIGAAGDLGWFDNATALDLGV